MHTFKPVGLADFVRSGKKIKQWLTDIADHSGGEFTEGAIFEALEKRSHFAAFYCDEKGKEAGLIVMTVVPFAEGSVLSIVGAAGAAGGDAGGWGDLTSLFNETAKGLGCVSFEIRGRRGFMKTMKPHGWKEKYTVIECPVSGGDQ